MARRLRLASASLALSAALIFSVVGVVSLGASMKAKGKVVSAKLTKTSFPTAEANTVKFVYKISPASKRVAYLLSLKTGTKWVKVRSVSKTGSFRGSYKTTVKKLFGSKAVKVGQYRVKISADANSLSRKFEVIAATSSPPPPPATPQPKAGFWMGTGSDEVISYVITFTVTSGGTNVTDFQVTFDDEGCEIYGGIVKATSPYSISGGSFSSPRGNPSVKGSFDSETKAHGTSRITGYASDICDETEYADASWTATWHSES